MRLDLVPILFALGLEFCQLVHFTHGTFDSWDIAFYLVFWLLAYYAFQSGHEQKNILSPFTLQGFICLACFFIGLPGPCKPVKIQYGDMAKN